MCVDSCVRTYFKPGVDSALRHIDSAPAAVPKTKSSFAKPSRHQPPASLRATMF